MEHCNPLALIPAYNEAQRIAPVIAATLKHLPALVVDDGSRDDTAALAEAAGATVLRQIPNQGKGAALRAGLRWALAHGHDSVLTLDADGQHDPADIPRLLDRLEQGYDMAVGARDYGSHAGQHRALANSVFNRLASWMVNHRIDDLTSGFRAVRADKFRRFLHLLPNGFSYPTTITMSFFRAGFPVAYVPIQARRREGNSHIQPLRDGTRFLLIIVRIGTLYSPFKLFLPVSLTFFLTGLVYYAYTLVTAGRFTNGTTLMFTTAILTFLIGIVSEQITALHFKDTER